VASVRHCAKRSSKSVKWLHRYGDLTVFKIAALRHVGFLKFKFFNGQIDQETHFASSYEISQKYIKRLWRNRNFCDLQDVVRRHLRFSWRVLGLPAMTTWWCVSFCKIWLKSMR